MKIYPLTELQNEERARLLYKLFPDEIPGLLEFTNRLSDEIINNSDKHRAKWNVGIIDFEEWLFLSQRVKGGITAYNEAQVKSSTVFIQLLYKGYQSLFMNHCIQTYSKYGAGKNPKCALAIQLLFD